MSEPTVSVTKSELSKAYYDLRGATCALHQGQYTRAAVDLHDAERALTDLLARFENADDKYHIANGVITLLGKPFAEESATENGWVWAPRDTVNGVVTPGFRLVSHASSAAQKHWFSTKVELHDKAVRGASATLTAHLLNTTGYVVSVGVEFFNGAGNYLSGTERGVPPGKSHNVAQKVVVPPDATHWRLALHATNCQEPTNGMATVTNVGVRFDV